MWDSLKRPGLGEQVPRVGGSWSKSGVCIVVEPSRIWSRAVYCCQGYQHHFMSFSQKSLTPSSTIRCLVQSWDTSLEATKQSEEDR